MHKLFNLPLNFCKPFPYFFVEAYLLQASYAGDAPALHYGKLLLDCSN